jgi:protein O-GlcNAc transferase
MPRIVALLWQLLGRVLERRGLGMLAESCFIKAIESAPDSADESRFRLGRLLLTEKRYLQALPMLEAAMPSREKSAESWNILGIARRESGDMEGAKIAFDRALAIDPDLIQAHNNLGNWLLARGVAEDALAWFDKALDVDPNFYEALNNRIVALLDLGRGVEAEQHARAALERYPGSAPLHLNLGNSYLQQGKGHLALQSYKRALELQPGFEEAHFNHSLLDAAPQHLRNAINFLKKEVESRGRSVDLLNRLAIGHMANLSFVEAQKLCEEILSKRADFVPAHITLGNVLSITGQAEKALESYQRALDLRPNDVYVHSNIVFEMNYFSGVSARTLLEKHLEWATRHEQPLEREKKSHLPGNDRNRRLKVGYVSPDFLSHPVGYLTRGIFRRHDKEKFEIHCYAHVARPDHITEEIRNNADFWHDTTSLNDSEVAKKIVEDKIDILVDLAGHTADHRLPVFARKPAPIQLTWVGYFHSTGMSSIDYFVTDPYTSPRGSEQLFSETPVYLPHTRFCYSPPEYAPEVEEPPCIRNGFVTLGSFNKIAKMTDEVVATWANIMTRLPDSRLWLKSPALNEQTVRESVQARFAEMGVTSDRIILRPASGHVEMLKEYGQIDIALDPFPYTGGITTFEALLMGVPVVTLARQGVVSRQSASALANLGLHDLIHETIPDYLDGVVALANDKERLGELRRTLRPTMERSPLCDIEGFTKDLEHLYRDMWYAWCDGGKLPSSLS